jgi:hypothetical protein
MTLPLRATLIVLLAASALLWEAPSASAAPCDQTLSVGANIASAVAGAANGATICLNNGDYGTLTLSNITRTGFVTITSASGTGARIRPRLNNVDFVKFLSLTLTDMRVENCSTNIQVLASTFVPNAPGLVFWDLSSGCGGTNKQHLVDGSTFSNVAPAWGEGRVGLVEVNGVTLSNNLFSGHATNNGGDGIQTGGNNNNIQIGPGNIFRDIRQGPCNNSPGVPHCDCIQFVGGGPNHVIDGNWFDNVEVPLQHHDGSVAVVFTNNLITNAVQFWAYENDANNSRVEHNTIFNLTGVIAWGSNGFGGTSTGFVGRSNLIIGTSTGPTTTGCAGCLFTHNLCRTSGQCSFNTSNGIVASPTFVGGPPDSITTWYGWKLAAGSPGTNAGHDGLDIGANFFGGAPAPPTNPRFTK